MTKAVRTGIYCNLHPKIICGPVARLIGPKSIGIRFKGAEKTNVEEYCVSEGWIRVSAGNAKDRHGNPLTIKLKGTVSAFYK